MISRHFKCAAVALSAGVALFLASTAASGEPAPQPGPRWFQQNWQSFGAQPYAWGTHPMGAPYGAYPGWGSDISQMWPHRGGGMGGASSNLQDMGGYYLFQLSLPGVNPNDLDIRVEGRLVNVSVLAQGALGSPQGAQWQTFSSNFQQVFTLPEPVDGSRMQSRFADGVLTVSLPKIR